MSIVQSILGLGVFTTIAWLLSERRPPSRAAIRVAGAGLGLQLVIAALLLRLPPAQRIFAWVNEAVLAIDSATAAGTSFVFGYLGGGPLPFEETVSGGSLILAFRALPLVIVVSALTALLTYWRVLPVIVRGFSAVLTRSFGVTGTVGLATAANVFVGMVEAPLFIRSYLGQMNRSDLYMVMCAGMATIAGTVLLLYVSVISPVLPDAAGHLLTASIISAPAAIMMAWLMIPPDAAAAPAGSGAAAGLEEPGQSTSSMDAITQGTQRGLSLYLNIIAMLVVLVALVQLCNAILGLLPDVAAAPLTLERMLGWLMAPVVWLMGIPWAETTAAGSLLGIKTVLNEFLAYLELARLSTSGLSERSALIMSYALCGMANLGSVGIMIGGFTTLLPERRAEVTELALRSVIGGTLATCCTGAVVAVVAP